jgi:hypothetical protein
MKQFIFPKLFLSDWKETRDTLQKYCRLVGAIRETLSIPLPYSLHTSLLICRKGFTTSSIPKNIYSPEQTFEVIVDLIHNKLRIESNYREPLYIALTGQSLNALCDETCSLLTDIGIETSLEKPSFIDGARGRFDNELVKTYWNSTAKVNILLKAIAKDLRGKTSPVLLRPDDLSLNLTWFSKETKKADKILAEQVEFGFSTGDENIPETYFYIYAFPETKILDEFYPPELLVRSSGNLMMATLPLSKIKNSEFPEEAILSFLKGIKPLFK